MSDAAVFSVPRALSTRVHAGSWALVASVLAVAAISPFERNLPVSIFGAFTISTVEAVVIISLVVFAMTAISNQAAVLWRSPVSVPVAALITVAALSAALAPEFQGEALKATGRLVAMAMVFVMTINAITSPAAARALMTTLVVVGSIVGAIAILELSQLPFVIEALRTFRPGFHVVGGQVRATSTLFYPTITSMYLEVIFALGLGLLAERPSARMFAALALIGGGIIATFTRAGLISMALSLGVVAWLIYKREGSWARAHRTFALLTAVLIAFVFVSHTPEVLLMRFGTDTSQDWYGATYKAPAQLNFRPGGVYHVPVEVQNNGMLTWQSVDEPAFALSYHWLNAANEDVVQFDGARTPFEGDVRTGEAATLNALVRAPGYPGNYMLVWDIVQEHRTWLSTEGIPAGRSDVAIEGEAVTAPLKSLGRLPGASVRMPRLTLWKAVLAMTAERPLIGVGPDNYRHLYGRYLQLANWDQRVHANNTYLEALADTGVLGLAALVWILFAGARAIGDRWRTATAAAPIVAALVAAWLSIAGHGLVDSFVTFTPTYVLFALTAGLTFGPAMAKAIALQEHPWRATALAVASE